MTTYSTGNPVGSADPRDLYDNAENLDNAANSDDATWTDRLGQSRRTMAGIEQDAITAIQNAGYVGTGTDSVIEDYASGIEITQYNQIVRDGGEFWRVSGSETLPYTLTGAGVPESGALVSVGDAALRQDLVQPVATFDSVSAMKASTVLGVGRKARTLGYYAPGDGGGCDYEIVASDTGSNYGFLYEQLTGSGLEAKLLGGGIMENKTVYVPSDYETIQEGVNFLSTIHASNNSGVSLVIEADHSPESGWDIDGVDLGFVTLASEDPVVTLSSSFIGSSSGGVNPGIGSNNAFYTSNGKSPTLGCLIDATPVSAGGSTALAGFVLFGNSEGRVLEGCGVIGAHRNLDVRASRFYGRGSVFRDSRGTIDDDVYHNVRITYSSMAGISGMDATGSSFRGIDVSRGSVVYADDSDASGCSDKGFASRRATLYCQSGVADNCRIGLDVDNKSEVYAQDISAKNCTDEGVNIRGCSSINMQSADVSDSGVGLEVKEHSRAYAEGLIANNCLTRGVEGKTANIDLTLSSITNCGDRGVNINYSDVTVDSATITGQDYGIVCLDANTVRGNNVDVSGNTTRGIQHSGYGNITSIRTITGDYNLAPNTLNPTGIIFTDA